ncbi:MULTISPECIES: gamma-glutamyl-gamma-aminobutyrate hydrolase family protein [Mycolicibacterium]|uniref:gamma-glutamyl-gamma-aminobutyrate hydrolase family protein n=1 Tax=Mycolicibacterium TaxID=1866885 RepID=UPI000434CCA5|nr:gamma-glutamyl-gamma-aminobutyrate hydrolase family protein [Mycolicibacterium mageritense]MCC9183504.1 gamma-glutamyl-gamma-aminobutyrate hydrolase family protein [Mycolicibacterium mageritense]CDO23632.1 peptidase C26 [Mycolicibacterium mageritense DSM 44476 = CIP 104973]
MTQRDVDHCSRAPVIGITGRRQPAGPLALPVVRDALVETFFVDYAAAVARAGGLPVLLTMECDPADVVSRIDGLILSGGADVDPRRYGAAPGPHATPAEPLRDEFEHAVLDAAWLRGTPVLGICRGTQLINVNRGGTLVAHLPADSGEAHSYLGYPRNHRSHAVEFVAGSVPHALYGSRIRVNSLHHQAVAAIGSGLTVTGHAPDGVVESIEGLDAPVVGVQWHPEMLDGTDPLFGWLVETARQFSTSDRKQEEDVVIA